MILDGKTAIVTGGAQGIGAGVVECLASEGARVVIFDIQEAPAKLLARALDPVGDRLRAHYVDITNYPQIAAAIDQVAEEWDRIDVLINNAGIVTPPSAFADSDHGSWEKTISVDFVGVLNGVKACLPHMVNAGAGSIVNIASDTARFGEPHVAVYAGAKGAVNSFSKSLAKEVAAQGIRVNVISPGLIDTPIIDIARSTPAGAKMVADTEKTIPLGRFGQPSDVGHMAAFLASDRAGYITGQTFSVNGGLIMFG